MKIRQLPEDFTVDEILDDDILCNEVLNDIDNSIKDTKNTKNIDDTNFNLYTLKKTNIENLKALSYVSKEFNIPLKNIGYCGLKDRHAITKQYITIPSNYGVLSINEKNLELKYIKTIKKPLKIGDLKGNRFEITVRDIDKNDFLKIGENLRNLYIGAPNYYDEQRFGSVFHNKFIAKEYLKGNYENILNILLTNYKKSENKRIKDLKRYIKNNWNNWEKILKYIKDNRIKSKMFVNIIKYLAYENNQVNYKEALKYVDDRLKKLFISAYQSYLWNECVKELLKNYIPKDERIYLDYSCGTFLFYKKIDDNLLNELKNKTFPTIAPDINYNKFNEEYKAIISKVLKKEGVNLNDFNKLNELGKLSYSERYILSIPKNINYGTFKKDELNSGKYKITVEFELNKGSYATIIIKRIFNLI
ncbi:tRNA pseudouridine(13) synthase TruD [Methanothermococcus okinawensis]|uniref:tRNA pseudouridine synthase D TruD n=1 Tax=Methanothermococcus okinawensis (strain DSM 14208 / JCM 11175 / IH1) TaxID=647113 RepID=F8AL92_METOI|nr:tRNA pseudouridine(13) synthase TruD [Methanothermococcus okinawensis]AEH06707.1 tRNA pseudouridine synthase D TruD [Methanothermococcus okinawensis IH1]